MYMSLWTVFLGVVGALVVTGLVNMLYRRKPWDLSP